MSNLVDAYLRYRLKNAEIKARHKQERESELLPLLRDMGYEIEQERKRGTDIAGIKTIIGNNNQSLIYTAKKAFAASDDKPDVPEAESSTEYTITPGEFAGDARYVKFSGDEEYILRVKDGVVYQQPEEWLTHGPERRKLYKQIIKEIENGAGT